MSDCRFGVSPVNYPDPDPDPDMHLISTICVAILVIESISHVVFLAASQF